MRFWPPAWLMGKKTRGPGWIELMETVLDRRLLHYASVGCNLGFCLESRLQKLQREDLGFFTFRIPSLTLQQRRE